MIGQRIKERRQELGISVDQLAKRIGKTRATMYRYENGESENINAKVLDALIIALDTSAEYLLGIEEPKPSVQEIIASEEELYLADRKELLKLFDFLDPVGRKNLIIQATMLGHAQNFMCLEKKEKETSSD